MPELPEVEHTRATIERVAARKVITHARVAKDPIVVPDGHARVARALRGRRIVGVERHGKLAWLVLDDGPALTFHLGMSGAWRFPDDDPLALSSSPKVVDRSWPPRFWKIELTLEDGAQLAMIDPRRLGRLWLRDDPRAHAPAGFDALHELPAARAFAARLSGRRGSLKGLLLDQGFAAGVGNWIADEVLYRAGLDPRRDVRSLAPEEIEGLRRALRHVVRTAVKVDARKDRFPRSWLFHVRWGKDRDARTHDGERVEHLTVAGRTTAWVPSRQR
ncbi:MAG: hypothetical protein KF901_20860 [Myxococcales bacterium]|nr:hypothetical protein [Myxococcales bacterium]